MADKKYFLDKEGLQLYDQLIKAYVNNANAANTAAIEKLNGDASTEGSVKNIVNAAVADVIDGAPEALDTLKEISDWISSDETGTAALTSRVAATEASIINLQNADTELKAYVDVQDQKLYESIGAIAELNINSLFMEKVQIASEQTVADAIASLGENEMLVLEENSTVSEDFSVPAGTVIDANGATLSGNITVSPEAMVENAVFTGKVTIE